MHLRLQTDYALRTLMFLAHVDRRATAEEIAGTFNVSKDHLVKVVQQLARWGYVRTHAGRGGGISLAKPAQEISLREVLERMEGPRGVLECVQLPEVCPLEPGCRLRQLLIGAEAAFYSVFDGLSIQDLVARDPRTGTKTGGLFNLTIKETNHENDVLDE